MRKMATVAVALMLAGCAQTGGGNAPGEFGANKTTGGTLLGAIGGGLAGAQFGHGTGSVAAAALGTLLGAFVGHEVGTSLDRADQAAESRAEKTAFDAPLGHSITWNNPDTGHSGTITPVREGADASGNPCREFQQQVTIDGRSQSAYGTACHQPDGSWKIIP
ncbi:MAG: RT0821/Lpp0805 family surface protein [Actinomycetota bacterium]